MSKKMMDETDIALRLSDRGLPSVVEGFWSDIEDGSVFVVGTKVHVQVGRGYACVTKELDDGETFEHFDVARFAMVDIEATVREALQ